MLKYHTFSSLLSLYPQQVSQELMAAFVIGKQYMQEVSDYCRLCIMPADISVSRHSIISTLYYYLSQHPTLHRLVMIRTSDKVSKFTLPSSEYYGINYVLGKKIDYDGDLKKVITTTGLETIFDSDNLAMESEARYSHVHYATMLPQQCTILPFICPDVDLPDLSVLVDNILQQDGTMVILMDTFAFRPILDDQGKQDMQTLVYEPGGQLLRFFNRYVSDKSWLFYALRVDKAPLPADPDRYISILMAG